MEDVIVRWDIIERVWKPDWSEPVEQVDIDIGVKVQIGVISDIIEEVKARHEIAQILAEQVLPDDPTFG